jgi:2-succinyl-5-enolpyruvyl-6-hydroxy-3-cyclohexene-1-carboxylate synthase
VSNGDVALAAMTLVVDELVRGGVSGMCIAPGSRSTPVVLAAVRDARIPTFVHLDERSAAFFALGRARATGAPCAVVCTSGTAAANFFPAVVEASMSRVPLIVLTADRPPEMRGTGANQTIDQTKLYGDHVRWFFEPGVPVEEPGAASYWRSLGARAVNAAIAGPPGPVHINLAFREPLTPEGRAVDLGRDDGGRAGGAPWERIARAPSTPDEREVALVAAAIAAAERGVIMAGGGDAGGEAVAVLAARAQWPLIAEPHSDARIDARALSAAQFLLADEDFARAHVPDLIVRTGAPPTSRAALSFAASAPKLKLIDPDGWPLDPSRRASRIVRADPAVFARALGDCLPANAETPWLKEWRDADAAARAAVDALIDAWDEPFEGRVARDVAAALPDGSSLIVGSSMPIRDLDAYMHPRFGVRVIANRGASGIDGFVSTALGVASADGPTYALTGDLGLLHDASGLLWSARDANAVTFVVLNNGGGGIFDLLPSAVLPESERYFVTPHEVDLRAVAAAAGIDHVRVTSAADVVPAMLDRGGRSGASRIVEVVIDRARALEQRRSVRDAVARALGRA